MPPAIIVHGGAWDWPDAEDAPKTEYLRQAARAGYAVLCSGGSALDAVEKAVNILEDAPLFDAGIGSHLNADGIVEMDAIIVDGTALDFGAVAGVQRVRYPVSLARQVMQRTPHKLFVGAGADALAAKLGLELMPNIAFVTPHEWQRFLDKDTSGPSGTVGACALDAQGHLAAATSTGGSPLKMPGRVGDSPIFGAGAYADSAFGAASATGLGENILRALLCKHAVDQIAAGQDAQAAADAAIAHIERRFRPSMAGLITIDQQGRLGFAHSSPKIAVAYIDANGHLHAPEHRR
ncbi:isoaspartyl peptidase/L-asparaginase [Aggregatilineales bacterium SYSU G02658]